MHAQVSVEHAQESQDRHARCCGGFSFERGYRFRARENNTSKNACGGDLALGGATDSAREKIMKTPGAGEISSFERGYQFRARKNKNA